MIKPPRSAEGSYRNCHSLYFFFLLNMRIVSFSQTLATPTMGPLARSCWPLELVSPCDAPDAAVHPTRKLAPAVPVLVELPPNPDDLREHTGTVHSGIAKSRTHC